MVGVPRNKGCQNCVSKRFKCDQTRPQCQRCTDRGLTCPGYARVFKFQDEVPGLQQKYKRGGSSEPSSSRKAAAQSSTSPESETGGVGERPDYERERERERERTVQGLRRQRGYYMKEGRRTNFQYKPIPLTIDEGISPSLAVQTLSAQQVQVFVNYLMTAWPCLFKCTETRVPVTWVEFVARRGSGSEYNPFDLGLRATTCLYMGEQYGDDRLQHAGRYLYGKSLRVLAASLSDAESGKADDVLAAAISLSVYEMYCGETEDSWLSHHAGIVEIMRLRGAKAHVDGFARAIYIAYRGFAITAALLTGEACFLAQAEWQEMSETIAADNAKQPDSSLFTEIAERAFREMVKVPGFVKRVRHVWNMPAAKRRRLVQPQLRQELITMRASLRALHTEFGITVATHGSPDNKDATFANDRRSEFIGPVPYAFFDGFSSLAIRGIRQGIILVDELLILLSPEPANQQLLREEVNIFTREEADDPSFPSTDLTSPQSESSLPSSSSTAATTATTTTTTTTSPPKSYESSSSSSSSSPRSILDDTSNRTFPIQLESLMTPQYRKGPNTTWTDTIATSYGMLGVRIRIIEDVSEPEHSNFFEDVYEGVEDEAQQPQTSEEWSLPVGHGVSPGR